MRATSWTERAHRARIREASSACAVRTLRGHAKSTQLRRLRSSAPDVRVLARGVVGGVADAGDFRDACQQRLLDALLEGDVGHAAAMAAAAEAQVDDAVGVDRVERDLALVR